MIQDAKSNPRLRSRQETLGVAGATTGVQTRPLLGAASGTQTNPDGTSTVSTTSILANGNQQTQVQKLDSENLTLETSTSISDAMGRTLESTNGRGHIITYTYHSAGGQLASTTQVNAAPGGGNLVTSYAHTVTPGSGILVTTTLPDGSHQYQETNLLGQTVRQWGSQTNPVSFTYDSAGRMATHSTYRAPVGANADTFPLITGDTTQWVYDSSGVLVEKIHADGKKTVYGYDVAGKMTTRTWARGIVTTYSYTAGQVTQIETFGSAAGWANYRDLRTAWQAMLADPANHSAQQIADAEAAMLAAKAAGSHSATPNVSATYNRLGQLTSATQLGAPTAPDTDITFGYNPASLRFATETVTIDPDGSAGALPSLTRTIDRSRDALQRPTGYELKTENLTLESSLGYGYDVSGRLASISASGLPNLPGKSHAFEYSYEPGSRMIDKVAGPVHEVDNDYEANRNVLLQKKNTRTVGTPGELSVIGYGVNAIGQRVLRNLSGEIRAEFYGGQSTDLYATDWGYDPLGQVTSEDKPSTEFDRGYSYDQIGNRLASTADAATTSYASNPLNQYSLISPPLPASPVNPGFDDDGNMTSGLLNGSSTGQFEYDGQNQLIRTQSTETSDPTRYAYDAFGRRVAKVTYPNAGSTPKAATVFIYDGWNIIGEYKLDSGTWALDRTYTWGTDLSGSRQGAGGVGGLLAVRLLSLVSESPVYFPIYDGNGNIEAYLDANGMPAAIYQYDAFGNTLIGGGKGAAIEQTKFSHRFSTKYQHGETGLLYYGYRYYHAAIGRWVNRDPIEEHGGVNLNGFVGNDGTNSVDLYGLAENFFGNYKCGCDKASINQLLREYALKAVKASEDDKMNIPQAYRDNPDSTGREHGGRVCCDPISKTVKATEPVHSTKTGVGNHPGITYDDGWNKGPNYWEGVTINIEEDAPPCKRFGENFVQVAQYHSHPRGSAKFSDADYLISHGTWSKNDSVPSAVGAGDKVIFLDPSWTKIEMPDGNSRIGPTGNTYIIQPDGTLVSYPDAKPPTYRTKN